MREFESVDELVKQRKDIIGRLGRDLKAGSRRDALIVVGGAVAERSGGLMAGFKLLGGEKLLGAMIDSDWFKNLIANPSEVDLVAAEKLPEPYRSNYQFALRQAIQDRMARNLPTRVSSGLQRFLNEGVKPAARAGATTGAAIGGTGAPVQTRGDIMRNYGRDPSTGAPLPKGGQPGAPAAPAASSPLVPPWNAPTPQQQPPAPPAAFAPTTVAGVTGGPQPDTQASAQELAAPIEVYGPNGRKGFMSVGAFDPSKYKLTKPEDEALLPAGGPTLPDDFRPY
jgi:hypothetical protein